MHALFTHAVRVAAVAAAMLPALTWAMPLTLPAALELAVQRSETARGARAGVQSATDAARAAAQLPDPMLRVGVDNLPVTGVDRFSTTRESMTMKRIGIGQEWLSSEKRAARQAAADAMVSRETAGVRTTVAEIRLQTTLAYLDAYFAAQALGLAVQAEHHAHEELEAARARLSAAAGNSQEALALTAARGMAADETADARQQAGLAQAALQRWVGATGEVLEVPEPLEVPDEPAFVENHPGVVAAERDVAVTREETKLASANRKPNWTWEVSYGQRSGYPDLVSVGVSMPLPVAPAERQDREVASKLALAERSEAGLAEARRIAEAEYRALQGEAQRLADRVQQYLASVVLPAQQRTEAALAGYRSNQVALMAVFEARHAELEAQRKLLTLQRNLARTRAQLAFRPVPVGGAQ